MMSYVITLVYIFVGCMIRAERFQEQFLKKILSYKRKNLGAIMKNKTLIDPRRRRKIPPHFSWVDHRLVREGYTRKCSAEALGLYLFLTAVSDSEGLSYYGDKRISLEINSTEESVQPFRKELISAGLIAFRGGMYQVLDLGVEKTESTRKTEIKGTHSMNDILESMFGGGKND
jgi:hypothetical protein